MNVKLKLTWTLLAIFATRTVCLCLPHALTHSLTHSLTLSLSLSCSPHVPYLTSDEKSQYGAFTNIENNALKVSNRRMSENGPQYDMSPLFVSECLIPDQTYLLSIKIKLDRQDGTKNGEPTTCANTTHSDYCPHVRFYSRTAERHSRDSHLSRLYAHNVPNYGEWYTWNTKFTLNEEQLLPDNIYALIRLYHAEPFVDISVDHFRVLLPAEGTYPNPDDLCGELIMNGDAEVRNLFFFRKK